MSATAQRVPLAEAQEIADRFVSLIAACTERVEICGSIRRRRQMIGDIDIVALARTETVVDPMFGWETSARLDLLDARCDELLADGTIGQRLDAAGRPRWGTASKRIVFEGLNVDLNAVDPTAWGVWVAIRTGPADYSHRLVTPRSVRIGGPPDAPQPRPFGLLPPGFAFPKGTGFQLHRFGGRVETPTEESFFDAIGLPYVAPWDRR